jgi:hypothetical protein
MKTIEEAFKSFKEEYPILNNYDLHHLLQVARFGAKWQEKKMYSEEEVYNLLEKAIKDCYTDELEIHYSGDYKNLKEWFEEFKKQ